MSLLARGSLRAGISRLPTAARYATASLSSAAASAAAAPSPHAQSSCAPLYDALKDRLGSPTAPLPMRQVYHTLVNTSRLVEEFNFTKTSRRRARQHAAFRFLRRHNVLMHSLLFYAPDTATWNVTPEFDRLSLVGASVIRAEVRARLLKLFPQLSHHLYVESVEKLTSSNALSSFFDVLEMEQLVGARPHPCSKDTLGVAEKSAMLCAMVGEMHWFAARTKATDRTHNNALFPPSDVLILHVLCTHLLECVPAELIFSDLEPVMEHIRCVWVNAPMSLPSQLALKPRTISALSLSAAPHTATAAERERRTLKPSEAPVGPRPLTRAPETDYLKSRMRPIVSHKRFDGHSYEVGASDREGAVWPLSTHPVPKGSSSPQNDSAQWNAARRDELAHPERVISKKGDTPA